MKKVHKKSPQTLNVRGRIRVNWEEKHAERGFPTTVIHVIILLKFLRFPLITKNVLIFIYFMLQFHMLVNYNTVKKEYT